MVSKAPWDVSSAEAFPSLGGGQGGENKSYAETKQIQIGTVLKSLSQAAPRPPRWPGDLRMAAARRASHHGASDDELDTDWTTSQTDVDQTKPSDVFHLRLTSVQ